jgi:DNA-binding transcriptional LysR family regulator
MCSGSSLSIRCAPSPGTRGLSDGSAPIWGPLNDNVEEMLEHVAARAGICFAPASMARYYARSDIAWRPLVDVDDLEMAVGYLSDRDNRLAQEFARIVCEQSEICEPSAPEKSLR